MSHRPSCIPRRLSGRLNVGGEVQPLRRAGQRIPAPRTFSPLEDTRFEDTLLGLSGKQKGPPRVPPISRTVLEFPEKHRSAAPTRRHQEVHRAVWRQLGSSALLRAPT